VRLHLIDGTYELFRAHYSKRPEHAAPDGQDVKATVGLVSSMLWLLEDPEELPTHLGIAFDNPIESFRNDMFPGYKTGAGIEPTLRAQFDLIEVAARALGFVVWRMDRWEADDALATAARRWRDDVEQVRILTPDKDLGQCVRGTRVVQVDRVRDRVLDEEGVRARSGVPPAAVPDYLALVGDDADGIPGLPGWGAKSSSVLLSHYGSVEAIPDDPEKWEVQVRGAARLAGVLAESREEVALYKQLATLVDDVPLEESLDDLQWHGVPKHEYQGLYESLGSTTLSEKTPRWR
jgi:5'-3' exonuclease